MLNNPSDVRRQGRRLREKIEGINLNHPLGEGFHAELCAMARSLEQYKQPMWFRTGDQIELPHSPNVWSRWTINSVDINGFVWLTSADGTKNRLSGEAIRKNARLVEEDQ